MDSENEVPEGRCGFVLEPGDVPEHAQGVIFSLLLLNKVQDYEAGSDEWYADSATACCWRRVWDGGDGERCIWHADTDNKPAEELVAARADNWEVLDGAYVPAVELGDAIDFEDCQLWAATFDGTGLQEASFAGVDGRLAQFPDVDLQDAQFPNAVLHGAQFPDANLWRVQFPRAILRKAQFPDTDLTNAQFPDAHLHHAQFPDVDLTNAQFPDAYLFGAQFPDANLEAAQFPDANLFGVQCPDAVLRHADLSDTTAAHATFTGADLEAATLTDADLGDADLTNARLHDANLRDVRINEGTTFGDVTPDEARATRLTPAGLAPYVHQAAGTAAGVARQLDYAPRRAPATDPPRRSLRSHPATLPGLRRLHATLRPRYEAIWRWWFWYHSDREALTLHYEDLGKANKVYRTIQRLYRENSMPEEIAEYQMRAKETRRKQAIIDRNLPRWLYLAGQRWVMGYGEQPLRVVATSVAVVFLTTLLYPLWGLSVGKAHEETARVIGYPFESVGVLAGLGKSLYFSVITFTTLGYGDVQPVGFGELLATVESFGGAFLLALLVYVLGRRATR